MDLDDFDQINEAEMRVVKGGQTTDVVFIFAGPGHERGIAQTGRVNREQLQKRKLQEQAQINGKKWRAPEQDLDEVKEDNIKFVLERLIGWSGLTVSGEPLPFNAENARNLLSSPNRAYMLQQAIEFIIDDNSFMPRSPKN